MRTLIAKCLLLTATMFFTNASIAQKDIAASPLSAGNTTEMKTFLIEREIPEAGKLTPAQLKSISQKSCSVLKEMGPQIQWVHSYVTGGKIYCIYKATKEELLREHAKKGGFPANTITEIGSTISPATAHQ